MRIYIKPICPEILGMLNSGCYEIDEGLSALEVLASALRLSGADDIPNEVLNMLVYMRNGKHISSETVLIDGDQLMALRPVYGG